MTERKAEMQPDKKMNGGMSACLPALLINCAAE